MAAVLSILGRLVVFVVVGRDVVVVVVTVVGNLQPEAEEESEPEKTDPNLDKYCVKTVRKDEKITFDSHQ